MDKWPLPEGWEWQALGRVVVDTERIDPTEHPEEPFTYIEISSVDSKTGEIVDPRQLLGKNAPSRARRLVKTDDVIFATTRPYLRNIALVPEKYDKEVCTTGFCVLRANREQVEPKWLFYVTRSNVVMRQIELLMHGASYPAVTNSETLSVEIPLPPLDVQRRLVARIETLLEHVTSARSSHEAINASISRLMEATLKEVFDDLRQSWPEVVLDDDEIPDEEKLCMIVPGRHILSKNYTNSPPGTPYITGPADFGQKFPEISRWTNSPKVFSEPGDVLFTVKGSGIGKVNCASKDHKCAIGRQIMALRPDTNRLLSDFLFYTLLGRFEEFQGLGRGAAIPGIRKEHVQAISLPLPDLNIQRRIIAHLESVQMRIDEMYQIQKRDGRLLDNLEQAIFMQAFHGDL